MKASTRKPAKSKTAEQPARSKGKVAAARKAAPKKKNALKKKAAVKKTPVKKAAPKKQVAVRKAKPALKQAKSIKRAAVTKPSARKKVAPRKKAPSRPISLVPYEALGEARMLAITHPDPMAAPPSPDGLPAQPTVLRPGATFDPTPDTNVPPRGHTAFDRNTQTERVAANKASRARIGSRRKH